MIADKGRGTSGQRVFGPASPVGVVVGLVVQSLGLFGGAIRDFGLIVMAVPLVSGLVCCVFTGRARHFGVGVAVSMTAMPLSVLALIAGSAASDLLL